MRGSFFCLFVCFSSSFFGGTGIPEKSPRFSGAARLGLSRCRRPCSRRVGLAPRGLRPCLTGFVRRATSGRSEVAFWFRSLPPGHNN
ncbi:hypothetical protein PVAP13_1KG242910 [Panicum virgatum]|uniref:Secreted protein n=1 Tax=Panicum virgatum TaxID=38727 RepID=A0A8T0XGY4_PANVG|nr:hypothetical protein PVAP13_1KG242910 [Panicum virgatum]